MQVITDLTESKNFVTNMIQSLVDLSYWKGWSVLVVTAKPDLDWIKQAKITAMLRSQLPDDDGSLLWMEGCFIGVVKKLGSFELNDFTKALIKTLHIDEPKVDLLSIEKDAEALTKLLAQCLGRTQEVIEEDHSRASFAFLKTMLPNIETLFQEWNKAKETHEGRDSPVLLLVDDDTMTRKMVSQALAKTHVVHTAENGAEAIAKHLQLRPDIIFLDIGLPDCDGLTLLNYMQEYDKECRVVMFSADDYLKTRVQAFAGGAKGFLPKPFNLKSFHQHIARWVSKEEQPENVKKTPEACDTLL